MPRVSRSSIGKADLRTAIRNFLAGSGHGLRSRAWCDFASCPRAKSRSGLRKPGYAVKINGDEIVSARMRSYQVHFEIAVRVGLTCVSTSGEGVLAIAFMIRFCKIQITKA